MAEISSGNDNKDVERTSSFKLFGRSPARSLSSNLSMKKKSNPLSRIFSRKKSEKPNVPDAENDSSSSSDDDTGKPEAIENFPTIEKLAEETIPQVIDQVARYANILETPADQEKKSVIPDAEPKESTPATTTEKKPELLGKLMAKAEKTKQEIIDKGYESVMEVYSAVTQTEKAPLQQQQQQPIVENDKKLSSNQDEKSVSNNTTAGDEVITTHHQRLSVPDEEVVGVVQEQKQGTPSRAAETTTATETPENVVKEEDNCVASLAQGLQKICSSWNNNNKQD